MTKYIVRRIFMLAITIFLISVVTFAAFSVIPGDAAITRLGNNATPERIANLREQMGLDDPLIERYVNWAKGAVKGDFGESFQYQGYQVSDLLKTRISYTALIGILAIILLIFISFPLGILWAKCNGKTSGNIIMILTHILMAVPSFFMGILLTYIFGVVLRIFSPGRCPDPGEDFWGAISYLIFPAMAVALPKVAMVVKYIRNAIVLELENDYVRTAYSKGCSENRVLKKHVLKNAMITVVTFMGMVIAEILAGSIIVEKVFSISGVGKLLVNAILNRDYPIVQATVIYIAVVVMVCNTAVDLLYSVMDPRVKIDGQ